MIRFRFSLRDLLWLVVLVAVALGWFAEHRKMKTSAEMVDAEHQRVKARAELAENENKWKFHYIFEIGNRWAAEVKHDVAFTDLDGSTITMHPAGGATVTYPTSASGSSAILDSF